MEFDLETLKAGFATLKEAVSAIKGVRDLLPNGEDKEKIEAALEKAEHEMRIAEASIAQGLGYKLCQCTYPPQIMLSVGMQSGSERFQCPECKQLKPPVRPAPKVIRKGYGRR